MPGERTKNWTGSKWIWPATRLAIYNRDRFRCSWCDRHVREVALCLDHIIRVADGGTNHPTNLVTSCFLCNRDRERTPPVDWGIFLTAFWDRPDDVVAQAVTRAREVPLDRAWGREQVKANPSWLKALRKRASTAWVAENWEPEEGYPWDDDQDDDTEW